MNEPLINGGYILLSRKIIESEIFKKPPLYLKVWVYLLSCAQHKKYKSLEKGQLYTSIPEIQEACSYMVGYRKETPTKDQIYKILEWLRKRCDCYDESDDSATMITTTKATHGLLVNIDKYSFYQNPKNYESNDENDNDNDTKAERERRQANNINKNDKNDKNINKDIRHEYEKRYSDDSFEIKCVSYLIKSIKDEMPNAKVPSNEEQIDKWCDNIEKMVRLDKRTQDDIYNTLVFARTNSFWKVNIRSTSSLRDKYETLYLQMKSKKETPNQSTGKVNKFNAFPQREYTKEDYLSMEQRLLNRN